MFSPLSVNMKAIFFLRQYCRICNPLFVVQVTINGATVPVMGTPQYVDAGGLVGSSSAGTYYSSVHHVLFTYGQLF